MMTHLVVFDVDGTLVDSQANILSAMNRTFDRHDLAPPDPYAVRRVVGLSLTEAMQVLLPDAPADLHARLAEDYRTIFQTLRGEGRVSEPLYPGAREALESLAGAGILLGLATGKSDRGLAHCLDTHGLRHLFVTLQTADRHPSKPDPAMLHAAIAEAGMAPQGTWMVGDTMFDMAMGQAAGTRTLGVNWGYHEPQELIESGAARVVASFPELLGTLREEGAW